MSDPRPIETKRAPLTRDERLVLEWLAKEDSSAYGECCGEALDSLHERGFVSIRPAVQRDINYARVSVTDAGHSALAKGGEG